MAATDEHEHEHEQEGAATTSSTTAADSAPQEIDAETRKLLHEERSCIFETRVERASKCRDRGSDAFKRKDVAGAVQWYERALFHVDFDEGTWHFEFLDKHRAAVNDVRLPVYLNLAACYLHATHTDVAKAIENADLALAIDSDNAKALYRGGKAHLLRDDLDAAKTKLTRAAKQQPNDKAIREALATLKHKLAEQKEKDKQTWGGRFATTPSAPPAIDSTSDARPTPIAEASIPTSSTAFYVLALLVLVLACIAGFAFA